MVNPRPVGCKTENGGIGTTYHQFQENGRKLLLKFEKKKSKKLKDS